MSTYAQQQWGSWDHPQVMDGSSWGQSGGQYFGRPYQSPVSLAPVAAGPIAIPVPPQTLDPMTGQPIGAATPTAAAAAGTGFDLSSLTSMTIFGIPVLYIGIALAAYFLFFKKGR